jgi:hypothetical protein
MHANIDEWTEITRKVLVQKASKRSTRRDHNMGSVAPEKILSQLEPPGYQMADVPGACPRSGSIWQRSSRSWLR